MDVLRPTDFSLVKNLKVDKNQIICAMEFNSKYLLIGCEHKNLFIFNLPSLTKVSSLLTESTVFSMLQIYKDILLLG